LLESPHHLIGQHHHPPDRLLLLRRNRALGSGTGCVNYSYRPSCMVIESASREARHVGTADAIRLIVASNTAAAIRMRGSEGLIANVRDCSDDPSTRAPTSPIDRPAPSITAASRRIKGPHVMPVAYPCLMTISDNPNDLLEQRCLNLIAMLPEHERPSLLREFLQQAVMIARLSSLIRRLADAPDPPAETLRAHLREFDEVAQAKIRENLAFAEAEVARQSE
jgi:hypothetical protein